MTLQSILLPVFVQVTLTFALLLWLVPLRQRAFGSGAVKLADIALGEKTWPGRAQQVANCFSNQFEVPVLFYALVILAIIARKADLLFVVLSWVFVISRIVHAAVHTGPNIVPVRGAAYGIGVIVLIVMWAIFAARILAA